MKLGLKSGILRSGVSFLKKLEGYLVDARDLSIHSYRLALKESHKNPLNTFGRKCFSQSDEDGITLEILRRCNILKSGGTFAEYGVGTGMENNTLVLRALGWKGFWAGNEELAFEISCPKESFHYKKTWISVENIFEITVNAQKLLNVTDFDVISLDLDGNDLYLTEELLSRGILPKLFIVEYNAKYFPPIEWSVTYDPSHEWLGDDYFGASLMSFYVMFSKYKYKLVCCNSQTGANAFFVRDDFSELFGDVPLDINDIYAPASYLLPINSGHKNSLKSISNLFS